MAYSEVIYPDLTGVTTDFALPFQYQKQEDVKAEVGGVTVSFSFLSEFMVRTDAGPVGDLRIYRETEIDSREVKFVDGATQLASQHNKQNDQFLFALQEAVDRAVNSLVKKGTTVDVLGATLENLGDPVNDKDAAHKAYVDDKFVEQYTSGIVDGSVTGPKVADGAISEDKLSDDAVTTGKIADVSVTTGKLGDTSVTSGKLADDSVTTSKLVSGSVTEDKISPDIVFGANPVDMRLAFLLIADNAGDRVNMSKGMSDPFNDDTDIDLATSTGESHNAGGKYFGGAGEVAAAGGTEIGDMTNMGGLAAAFDGTTNQARTDSADKSTGVSGFGNTVGKNWGTDKSITRVVVTAPNDAPFLNVGATSIKLQAHNGTDFVDVSSAIATSGSHGEVITFDTEISDTAAYQQHRVDVSGNGANAVSVAEVQFFETLSGDMTLVSNPFIADSSPAKARLHVQVKENEAITVNNDLTAEVSRDGGVTFTSAVLKKVSTLSDGTIAYEDSEIDITGQPSGTSMVYKISVLNSKNIEVHGVVMQWN